MTEIAQVWKKLRLRASLASNGPLASLRQMRPFTKPTDSSRHDASSEQMQPHCLPSSCSEETIPKPRAGNSTQTRNGETAGQSQPHPLCLYRVGKLIFHSSRALPAILKSNFVIAEGSITSNGFAHGLVALRKRVFVVSTTTAVDPRKAGTTLCRDRLVMKRNAAEKWRAGRTMEESGMGSWDCVVERECLKGKKIDIGRRRKAPLLD